MDVNRMLEQIADRLKGAGAATVYGAPVSANGRTVIPVARVAYGFGGGGGQANEPRETGPGAGEGAGGGGGVVAHPVGVVEITPGGTRFIRIAPWRSHATVAAAAFATGVLAAQWARATRKR